MLDLILVVNSMWILIAALEHQDHLSSLFEICAIIYMLILSSAQLCRNVFLEMYAGRHYIYMYIHIILNRSF